MPTISPRPYACAPSLIAMALIGSSSPMPPQTKQNHQRHNAGRKRRSPVPSAASAPGRQGSHRPLCAPDTIRQALDTTVPTKRRRQRCRPTQPGLPRTPRPQWSIATPRYARHSQNISVFGMSHIGRQFPARVNRPEDVLSSFSLTRVLDGAALVLPLGTRSPRRIPGRNRNQSAGRNGAHRVRERRADVPASFLSKR